MTRILKQGICIYMPFHVWYSTFFTTRGKVCSTLVPSIPWFVKCLDKGSSYKERIDFSMITGRCYKQWLFIVWEAGDLSYELHLEIHFFSPDKLSIFTIYKEHDTWMDEPLCLCIKHAGFGDWLPGFESRPCLLLLCGIAQVGHPL